MGLLKFLNNMGIGVKKKEVKKPSSLTESVDYQTMQDRFVEKLATIWNSDDYSEKLIAMVNLWQSLNHSKTYFRTLEELDTELPMFESQFADFECKSFVGLDSESKVQLISYFAKKIRDFDSLDTTYVLKQIHEFGIEFDTAIIKDEVEETENGTEEIDMAQWSQVLKNAEGLHESVNAKIKSGDMINALKDLVRIINSVYFYDAEIDSAISVDYIIRELPTMVIIPDELESSLSDILHNEDPAGIARIMQVCIKDADESNLLADYPIDRESINEIASKNDSVEEDVDKAYEEALGATSASVKQEPTHVHVGEAVMASGGSVVNSEEERDEVQDTTVEEEESDNAETEEDSTIVDEPRDEDTTPTEVEVNDEASEEPYMNPPELNEHDKKVDLLRKGSTQLVSAIQAGNVSECLKAIRVCYELLDHEDKSLTLQKSVDSIVAETGKITVKLLRQEIKVFVEVTLSEIPDLNFAEIGLSEKLKSGDEFIDVSSPREWVA